MAFWLYWWWRRRLAGRIGDKESVTWMGDRKAEKEIYLKKPLHLSCQTISRQFGLHGPVMLSSLMFIGDGPGLTVIFIARWLQYQFQSARLAICRNSLMPITPNLSPLLLINGNQAACNEVTTHAGTITPASPPYYWLEDPLFSKYGEGWRLYGW